MIDLLIHVANVLILLSFSVRDILWLRVLSILAGVAFIPYFLFQNDPLYEPVAWNSVFIAINLFQIWRLWLERRPVHLAEEQERLRQMVFSSLSPRELLRLLAVAQWRAAEPGENLCECGEKVEDLIVLYSGHVQVTVDGEPVAELEPGMFVGEMSFLTDEAASAHVTTTTPTRYVAWAKSGLNELLNEHGELRSAMQRILGSDMAKKLRRRT